MNAKQWYQRTSDPMEFKFRAVEDRPPPIYSPSPAAGNFSDQRFRGGYGFSPNVLPPSDYRGGYEVSPNVAPPSDYRVGYEPPNEYKGGYEIIPIMQLPSDYRAGYGFNSNAEPINYRESVQRELEKARIKEEIIAMEMERRRLVEAEARRLMMEQGMFLRRGLEFGLPFDDRLTMQFNQRAPFTPHPFDGRFIQDHRSAYAGHGSFNGLLVPPLQQRWPEPTAHQPQPEASKDKIIFLPKPQPRPDLSETKQKAVTPPTVLTEPKNKPNEEWSCALCQVSATSQKGLNHHLKGKKHKGREARLQAEQVAKNSNCERLPKKTIVPKPAGAIESAKLKPTAHEPRPEATKDIIIFLPQPQTELCGRKRKAVTLVPTESNKKPKEWGCALCQVSATSRKALNHHLKGKKHKGREARLQGEKGAKHSTIGPHSERVMKAHKQGKMHMVLCKKLGQNEAVAGSTTTPETTQEEKDVMMPQKQAGSVTAETNTPDWPPTL